MATYDDTIATPQDEERLADYLLAEWRQEHGFPPPRGLGESLQARSGDLPPAEVAPPAEPSPAPESAPVAPPAPVQPSNSAAIRYQGQQEYSRLVKAGATPEEALRLTSEKLYYRDPNEQKVVASLGDQVKPGERGLFMSKAGTAFYRPDGGDTSQPPPTPLGGNEWKVPGIPMYQETPEQEEARALRSMTPEQAAKLAKTMPGPLEITEQGGQQFYRRGPNTWSHIPTITPKVTPLKAPADILAAQKVAVNEMALATRDLNEAKKFAAKSPDDVDRKLAVENARSRLKKAEQAYITGSTNWQGKATAPASSTPPKAEKTKELDERTARAILAEVKGDRQKARELARQRGYTF